MTPAALHTVHFVDATSGPLVGEGRFRRMMPFAVTATISLAIALPSTPWTRPNLALVGCAIAAVTMLAGFTLPWHRLPRSTQVLAPIVFLVAMLLLASASGSGIESPFLTMSVLPLMWLAIYEGRTAVLFAAALTGTALWFTIPRQAVDLSGHAVVAAIVFFVCGAGMGITLHGFVADARRLTRTLRDQQVELRQAAVMLDALPERVNRYRIDDHAIVYCNEAWATQYDVDKSEAIGRSLDDFLSDDELDGLHSQLALLGPDNPVLVDSVARAANDARGLWLEWADRYLVGEHGPEVLSIGRDVTARHVTEMKLAEREAQFRDLADRSADVVWRFVTSPAPHFDYMSPSVENILGYPASYFLEDFNRILEILDEPGRAAIGRALLGEKVLKHFDFHFRHANGSLVIGETRTSEIRGGIQGVSRDVTELRQLQRNMESLALHDPLTGLANRRLFNELLAADVARTQRSGTPLAVAFVDLDDFKNVNDTFGHDIGDMVLCETARRLKSIVRGADTVARIGGDEFVIVYEPNDANSHFILQRIDRALAAPFEPSSGVIVSCAASVGIADSRVVGCDATALLAASDGSMYQVKRARQAAVRAARQERLPLPMGLGVMSPG